MSTQDSQSQSQSQSRNQEKDKSAEQAARFYNELKNRDGDVREHWQNFHETLLVEREDQLPQLAELTKKLLRDDGASYSIHDDPAGLNRAWELDTIPLLLPQDEWGGLRAGIKQRARILDLVLRDIYGPQRLIREGIVPAEIIFAHPGYVRAWVGAPDQNKRQLTVYAVDLARDINGQFFAISERAQNPSGSGYSLENRIVSARVLPDLFRNSRVLRLASYFRTLRETLINLAPGNGENPQIVILSPGPHNETYFEQAFLSSYLGISLVEGQDLVVRKGRVWMRSLYGDQPIDVILRRVDHDYCDPLEYRGESLLGVAGLTEVARRGNVKVVNPLGSGILESPALYPFMPEIARYFGEKELTLSQVGCWWGGRQSHLQYILDNLQELVVKQVWRRSNERAILAESLSRAELHQLRQRIKSEPSKWVAQDRLHLSRVPTSAYPEPESRGFILRGFATATDEDYKILPGGLVRVSSNPDETLVSNQSGSLSKDCWVLSNEEGSEDSLWVHPKHKVDDTAPEKLVHGRSAENLLWMGRYAERSEVVLNLLRFTGHSATVEDKQNDLAIWQLVLLTEMTFSYPGFTLPQNTQSLDAINAELRSLCSDIRRRGSLPESIGQMIDAAKNVHGLMSVELRRVIGQLGLELNRLTADFSNLPDLQFEALVRLKDQMLALNCLIGQSMIRGLAWRFLDIGRRVERAQMVLRLMKKLLVQGTGTELELEQLSLLLAVTDNEVSYQQRYASSATVDRVLDLLMLEPENPRSVAYQVKLLVRHMENMPGRTHNRVASAEERLIIEANTRLRLANSLELSRIDDATGRREALDELLTGLHSHLQEAAQAMADSYFTRVNEKQQILSPVSVR